MASWDSQALQLSPAGAVGEPAAVVEWHDVSSVWASLRTKEGLDISFEVGLETWGGEVDYVRIQGPINEASGRFLDFLQTAKSDRLKEGRAPGFALSPWAAVFYRHGISSNRLRVALGWTSIVFEVIFAVCFLTQIQRMIASRENKLLQELAEISRSLGRFGGIGTVVVLLQHCVIFLFVLRSICSTLLALLRSLGAFHRATKKAQKSLRKLSSKASVRERAPGAPSGSTDSQSSSGRASEGGELRQRKRSE